MDMKVSKAVKPVALGVLIDKLNAYREEKRAITEKLNDIEGKYKVLEAQIKGRLSEEGMDKATGKAATVSLSEVVVGNVTDWEKVYALIHKNKAYYLLQKRVSDPAFRELYDQAYNKLAAKKGFDPEKLDKASVVPGFEPFTKVNLNLTTLKK